MTRQAEPLQATRSPAASAGTLVIIGLTAGYLSGLFGVGGGVLVVPLLLLLGVDQRIAAGSSVAATQLLVRRVRGRRRR